jgi:hypothetical protein
VRPTVEISFDLSLAGAGDFLTLGDPVKGLLDSPTYVLAGEVKTDVSDDVRSVTIRRGRADETTTVDAGTATVGLDNRLRLYDPTAPASVSPYAPSILPRKEITISVNDIPLFDGQVEDWDLEYSLSGDSVTFAKASDGFTLLAQQTLASGPGATGISGSVIYETASAAEWPLGKTALDEGTASVGVHDISQGQKALPYLQKIVAAESAMLFIARDGTLTFRDRISPRVDFGTRFADDGTGIPFQNIEIQYGTEFLYTQAVVDYPAGSASAQSASLAVANYGLSTYTLDTFLPDGTEAGIIAAFFAERYGEPTFRIVGLEVQMDKLTASQQSELLNLDLGHGVEVTFTPNKIGSAIFRELAIDSIEHEIKRASNNSPSEHFMRFRFFEPFLISRSGSVEGTNGTAGSVTGFVGYFGSAEGSSGTAGDVTGFVGYVGSTTGSSGTAGSVTGAKTISFTLDTSLLDGSDGLG